MNVHQRVHERFINIPEQQMRLSWKFMSSWTYLVHDLILFMNSHFVHEHELFMNGHELR